MTQNPGLSLDERVVGGEVRASSIHRVGGRKGARRLASFLRKN
jgi:hypothetical protein